MARAVKLFVWIGKIGSNEPHRVEDYEALPDDWDERTGSEQRVYLHERGEAYLASLIDHGAIVVDDGEDE